MYFGRERKLEMTAAGQQDWFKHYYLCLTDFVKLLFIGGTKPVIRTVLESKYNSLKDEEALLDAAVEAEVAKSAPTALADRRNSQLEAEIAALRFSSNRGASASGRGSSSSRGGRGGGRGGSSNTPPRFQQQTGAAPADSTGLTHRQRVQLRNSWILCHKCQQWGKHRANECRLSATQISKLDPQDESNKPSGVPSDAQFDKDPKN